MKKCILIIVVLIYPFLANAKEEIDASRFCHSLAMSLADNSGTTGEEYATVYYEEYEWCENNDWELEEAIEE